jgi:hypothetical protein
MAKKKKAKNKFWIQNLKKGGLHKSLGVAEGETIPKGKINAAAKKSGKVGKQARAAKTLSKLSKKKGKK